MKPWLAVVDRTAVLFLGIAAGVLIGLSFGDEGEEGAPVTIPAATPEVAPPPPSGLPPAPGTPPVPGAPAVPAAPPPQAAPEVTAVLGAAGPMQQQVFETVRRDGTIRVGVFGDSFGDGVWSGLNRLLPAKDGFRVIKYSQQATGFTRYKSLNLEKHAAEQLGEAPLDIAVISYGANDTQGVYTGGGKAAALLTPAWQAEIGARATRFVQLLRAHGAQVYWVGLPRMRKGSFDSDIQGMNAFYAGLMGRLGVPFIDTRPASSDAGGAYAAYLPDPKDGHKVLIRADDGIHMSMNGYVWITRGLAGRIRAYVDAARKVSGGSAAPVVTPPPPPPPAPPRIAEPAPRPRPEPARRDPEPRRETETRRDPEPRRDAEPRRETERRRDEPRREAEPRREPERAAPRREPAPQLDLSPADLGGDPRGDAE